MMDGECEEIYRLVIAGPHADERNAQRVVMAAQRHFINTGVDGNNLLLYFIPTLSPTFTFADARGLPIVDGDGTKYGEKDGANLQQSIEMAIKQYTEIQYIHDLMEEKIEDKILRNHIQDQDDPARPQWGIDANRDINLKLPSSRVFKTFMELVSQNFDKNNLNVFMLHGYTERGDVYGPYYLEGSGKVRMEDAVKRYVNYIRRTLFNRGQIRVTNLASIGPEDIDPDSGFYFGETREKPEKYAGEWAYQVYSTDKEHGILSFDIELPGCVNPRTGIPESEYLYDEGRRGETHSPYIADRVGTHTWNGDEGLIPSAASRNFRRPFFGTSRPGFMVEADSDDLMSFYNFLLGYFTKRDEMR
jgi:hypothetical protein